jgi:hypothetical protein
MWALDLRLALYETKYSFLPPQTPHCWPAAGLAGTVISALINPWRPPEVRCYTVPRYLVPIGPHCISLHSTGGPLGVARTLRIRLAINQIMETTGWAKNISILLLALHGLTNSGYFCLASMAPKRHRLFPCMASAGRLLSLSDLRDGPSASGRTPIEIKTRSSVNQLTFSLSTPIHC